MPLSEEGKKLKRKIGRLADPVMLADIGEYKKGENTKQTRWALLRMAHYYHLLQSMGDDGPDNLSKMEAYCELARLKLRDVKESGGKWKELAALSLIDQHTRAWNLAQFYYEKGCKILCQVMVSAMDDIIQGIAHRSVLYKDNDRSGYLTLRDEIAALNSEYAECYYFLCAYDFCTEKIAGFMGINEYRELTKEHKRIIDNGLPQKAAGALELLREMSGVDAYAGNICGAFEAEPPYMGGLLEECYEKAVAVYGNDESKAMAVFSGLVIRVDEIYEKDIRNI